ncbi:hypothetical protein BC835DRAFT_1413840 [Cytidiella melzeri]|nr:hypothetical protein BC835DRAFT_1413840 [Cytidiella melzeri]
MLAVAEEDPGTPTHRSKPSLVTNASGFADSTMTFGSIMSSDGFARLSQFPSVPQTYPLSPVEETVDMPSPIQSELSLSTQSTTPPSIRALPIPPVAGPSTAPLKVQKRPPGSPSRAQSPLKETPVYSQYYPASVPTSGVPGLSNTPTTFAYPSPYDWHDGSSSIANDPYGAALPTSFITSLLTSASDGSDNTSFAPSSFPMKPRIYEPSVVSNALTTVTTDSTITYPPPKLFPPPLPGSPRSHPPVPPLPSHLAEHAPPAYTHPTEGRAKTPDTLQTVDSEGASTMRNQNSTISQTMGGMRAMSTTPSLQSLNSTTPLMQQGFAGAPVDPILEEEEFRPASGRSTSGKSRASTGGRRASTTYSTKSAKSYVSSLVARLSHSSPDRKSVKQVAVSWFRGKPLPPVPPLPNMPFQEIRKAEDALALPELAGRAQILSAMLDRGIRPFDSDDTVAQNHDSRYKEHFSASGVDIRVGAAPTVWNSGAEPNVTQTTRDRRGRSEDFTNRVPPVQPDSPTRPPRKGVWSTLSKEQRIWFIVAFIALIITVTVAVAVGVTVGTKHHDHVCPGDLAGASCNMNATCICTSQGSGQCKNLAQSLVSLVPVMNAVFSANYTSESVSDAIWLVQGNSSPDSCADQVSLIDVAPALDSSTSPNRTQWAQAALLWNIVRSENSTANRAMLDFVQRADWKSFSSLDGPTDDPSSSFLLQVSGYDFDFASQVVREPSASFVENGQPSADQLSRVNGVAHTALDRMYTFAVASSTQQRSALQLYWTSELQLPLSSLTTFLSYIAGSDIMIPFDSTTTLGSTSLVALIDKTPPDPFPPPLSCYPGLTSSQLQQLNTLESKIFGLTTTSGASVFDTTCFPNRPVYGVLDILQLRLPFTDNRSGVAKQAAVLSPNVNSRVLVYSGEVVSALPGTSSSGSMSTDPRDYGTLNYMDHVILSYLSSLDQSTASSIVAFVMNRQAVPPAPSSAIYEALSSLPVLEVAVFGNIDPSDVSSVVSSLSDDEGALYFATKPASIVRNWTIDALHGSVTWTENATAPLVVSDDSNSNPSFNAIWGDASLALQSKVPVTVTNITQSFNATQLFHQ